MVDEGSMGGATGDAPQSFSDRVLRLLERVEHRVATAPADREAAFQLRFEAYQKIGFLQRSDGDRLYDPRYDDAPNAWIITTFIDGELAGTVRVNIGSGENAVLPGLQVFADVLVPKLSAGESHRRVHASRRAAVVVQRLSGIGLRHHAPSLHGRGAFRRRLRGRQSPRGAYRILSAGVWRDRWRPPAIIQG